MLSVYINYPMGRFSIHLDAGCNRIQMKGKANQRILHIDKSNLEAEINKLAKRNLKFASVAGLNDVWIHIDLGDVSNEKNLAKTIQEILGKSYKRLAHAEIKTHCPNPAGLRMDSQDRPGSPLKSSQHPLIRSKETIPNREEKIEAIINTITSRIAEFNSLYRSGPSLYFYRRIIELRTEDPKITDFISNNYNLEILYATLVSWDMNSRGAKLKYFDDFKSALILLLPELGAIEDALEMFNPAFGTEMLGLLKSAFLGMELMKTSGRLVSNSKCLHFLFPSLCMPMDGTNTLRYLFGNTYESADRYLDIIRLSFDVMRQPVQFDRYLDDRWNQSVPKLIDNAIILLQGKSVKTNRGRGRRIINQEL
jgi:hypothetical protein